MIWKLIEECDTWGGASIPEDQPLAIGDATGMPEVLSPYVQTGPVSVARPDLRDARNAVSADRQSTAPSDAVGLSPKDESACFASASCL